jgi:YD repeat-containing protein
MNSLLRFLGLFLLAVTAGAATYTRDASGRLTRVAFSDGRVITYTYDDAGNRTATTVTTALALSTTPTPRVVSVGSATTLALAASGSPAPSVQWYRQGATITGATGATLAFAAVEPADAGLYSAVVTREGVSLETDPVLVAPLITTKFHGAAQSPPDWQDIRHPNGNAYDQVLLTGAACTVTADPGQVTRVSFIDLSDDIVQIEFSGAGSLTVRLDQASGPANPVKYNQAVGYMKGHPSFYLAGANATTNVSIFSVGQGNAVIPLPRLLQLGYSQAQLDSAGVTSGVMPLDKVPAALGGNGTETFLSRGQASALFRQGEVYDNAADFAVLALQAPGGRFGGARCGNAAASAGLGITGIHAPGVTFEGPCFVHDLNAFDSARPLLSMAGVAEVWITGGDLWQPNNRAVAIDGLGRVVMKPGTNSAGVLLPAQKARGRLERAGADVTATLLINP